MNTPPTPEQQHAFEALRTRIEDRVAQACAPELTREARTHATANEAFTREYDALIRERDLGRVVERERERTRMLPPDAPSFVPYMLPDQRALMQASDAAYYNARHAIAEATAALRAREACAMPVIRDELSTYDGWLPFPHPGRTSGNAR